MTYGNRPEYRSQNNYKNDNRSNNKRQYKYQPPKNEVFLDEVYLCKSKYLLSRSELSIFIPMKYIQYLTYFYKNKVKFFYNQYQNESWFIYRYLTNFKDKLDIVYEQDDSGNEIKTKKYKNINIENNIEGVNTKTETDNSHDSINKKINFFMQNEVTNEINKINLDTKDINYKLLKYSLNSYIVQWKDQNTNIEDVIDFVRKAPGFIEFNLVINKAVNDDDFVVYGILSLDEEMDGKESIKFLYDLDPTYKFIELCIKNIHCKQSNVKLLENDNLNAKKLVSLFVDKYNIQEKDEILRLIDGKNTDFIILLLRFVFNYCFYCGKQFDSHIEMAKECGDYHIRSGESDKERKLIDRKTDIILENKTKTELFEKYKNPDIFDNQIKEYCEKLVKRGENEKSGEMEGEDLTDLMEISCKECGKGFDTIENFYKHFSKKHKDIGDEIRIEIEMYNSFIDNIDFKALGCIEGTDDDNIPGFVVAFSKEERRSEVVYDTGHVYSGKISINRDF